MAKIYARLIEKGLYSVEEVPLSLQEAVKSILEAWEKEREEKNDEADLAL